MLHIKLLIMAQKSRLQISKNDIFSLFENGEKVLRTKQIGKILAENRDFWRLAKNTTLSDFIKFLTSSGKLKKNDFDFPLRRETLYTWGNVPLLDLLQNIKPSCYFSHFSAMAMHGLTEQTPRTHHLTFERNNNTENKSSILSQYMIDESFKKPIVETKNIAIIENIKVVLISGRFTNNDNIEKIAISTGVNTPQLNVKVTDLERTLIDIAVKPHYSGGYEEIIKAYKTAKTIASVNKVCALLRKYNYLYPYHQAIGFYMERAGYPETKLDLLKRFNIEYDFYLFHNMKNPKYNDKWKIYYPNNY